MKKEFLDEETKTFLTDLSYDGNITPYPQAVPNMTMDDATQLKELKEKFWSIDRAEDQEDGSVRTLGVLGEIDRLLKEIIARKQQA
jgi:hypothetical protein